MQEDFEQLNLQIEKLRNDFIDARDALSKKYPSLNVDTDIRFTVFNKTTNVMGSVQLGFALIIHDVSKVDWWKEKVRYGFDMKTIQTYCDEFNMFLRTGFIHFIFASIESSFRLYVRAIDANACSKGTDDFKNIYEFLLTRLGLRRYIALLDLIRNVRNSLHNNGLFFPKSGKDELITYKGKAYSFQVGKPNQFVTWQLMFDLVPDIRGMLVAVVETKDISDLGEIPDPS